jgi:murein L,D-transpeptidase YafK
MSMSIVVRFALVAVASLVLAGCPGGSDVLPAMKSLPPEMQVLLAKNGMKSESPIFVRIFKEESELEIWKQKDDGRFYHLKTYPICAWSGTLGPKVRVGDKQAPEGFYTVTPGQMNPNSQYHLAFNIGFPNAYDKVNGHTGDALMVHGDCKSAGCFAMTDALIEEIYILAREAFQGGQRQFQVNAFPFRMTEANLARYRTSQWYGFWKTLKEGYDSFEQTHIPPKVAVCSRSYLVNANFFGQEAVPDPSASCPAYRKFTPQPPDPFNPDAPTAIQAKAPQSQSADVTRVAAIASQQQPADASAKPFAVQAMQSAGQQPVAAQAAALAPTPVLAGGNGAAPRGLTPPNTQPVAASYPARAAAAVEPADATKPVETHGLHNVVGSGKGDMLAIPPADAPATATQVSYGQANTAGSAAFR